MSLDIGLYSRRMDAYKVIGKDGKVDSIKNQILIDFFDNPSYFKVLINNLEKDVHIVSDYRGQKKLLCKPGDTINAGDLIFWEDSYFVLLSLEDDKSIQSKGVIQRCNHTLKWQDQSNVIHTTPCILADKTSVYSDGLSKTEFISLGTDQTSILVQANEHTLKIPINKRFIFKNDGNNVYEVNRRDNLTLDGLISFVVKKSLYSPLYDNLELNIANYNGKQPEPEVPVEPGGLIITGIDKFTVYEKNIEYSINTDKPVTWTLSRTDVLKFMSKIDNKCVISPVSTSKIGKTILKATLVEDETIFVEKEISIAYA